MSKSAEILKVLERRDVSVILSAVLFGTNFLLIYFIWIYVFKDFTGIARLVSCWVGAYALTWFMTSQSKGMARLVLTLIFLGLLCIVFRFQP